MGSVGVLSYVNGTVKNRENQSKEKSLESIKRKTIQRNNNAIDGNKEVQ